MATEATEKSTAPARIVVTPGTCGGRPRIEGHRLDVDWYGSYRELYGKEANSYILRHWNYLREEQVQCMSDYYDAINPSPPTQPAPRQPERDE